jgi:CHAT domain-containing protein/tetratricopeptide (TPR) repeat protein
MRRLLALAACTAAFAAPGSDLGSALLEAKDAAALDALVRGRPRAELSAALGEMEKSGEAGFNGKPALCASAYQAALAVASALDEARKSPFYFRRLGICQTRLGQDNTAVETFRKGIAAAENVGDQSMLAENLLGAAARDSALGRLEEARRFCERALPLAEQDGHPEIRISALNIYSQVLNGFGLMRQALLLVQQSYELSPKSSRPGEIEKTFSNLAIQYAMLGDYETALRMLRTVKSPTAYDLDAIGIAEALLGHEPEAEAAYRAALAADTAPGLWLARSNTLANLALLQTRLGKLAEARANTTEALKIALAHNDSVRASAAWSGLSEIASRQRNAEEALRDAAEALRLARETQFAHKVADALVAQGHALETAGRGEEASKAFAEALAVVESSRAETPPSAAGLEGEIAEWMPSYQAAVAHELTRGHAMEALRLADRAKARVLLDMIGRGRPGLDAIGTPQERAEEAGIAAAVAAARRRALTSQTQESKTALDAAIRAEDDFNLRLYAHHPELVFQRAAPPDITAAQLSAMAPAAHTALISYFVLPDSVAIFVVTGGGRPGAPRVQAFSLPGRRKLDPQIRLLRDRIASRDIEYRDVARALFDALLAPAADALRESTRWYLSPDGALWDVPFQALIDRSGRHVVETRAVSYAPSLATLWQLQHRRGASRSAPLLAVGNPSVAGVPSLAASADESTAIANLYGGGHTTLLTGERATAAQFRASAPGAGIIHIASHAETETNHPLESFLLLAPGPVAAKTGDGAVTARDILGMPLHARLVVLAACETARGKVAQGEGVLGLAWAVLAAGARASVVSQWKVDSAATAALMIDFHRRLATGPAPDEAEALRQAALSMLRTPNRRHPFYWAPFVLLGATN